MANEIRVDARLAVANGLFKTEFVPGPIQVNQAAIGAHSGVVSVGTSEEDLPVGDVTTNGVLMCRNLDSTNYVQWGPSNAGTMVAVGRMKPNDVPVMIRVEPGVTIRWKANTAACKVQMLLLQD